MNRKINETNEPTEYINGFKKKIGMRKLLNDQQALILWQKI